MNRIDHPERRARAVTDEKMQVIALAVVTEKHIAFRHGIAKPRRVPVWLSSSST